MADITNGSLQPSSLIRSVTLLQNDFQDRFYQLLEKDIQGLPFSAILDALHLILLVKCYH